jgi:hypothetical protein
VRSGLVFRRRHELVSLAVQSRREASPHIDESLRAVAEYEATYGQHPQTRRWKRPVANWPRSAGRRRHDVAHPPSRAGSQIPTTRPGRYHGIVDALVVLLAACRGDIVVTSEPGDLAHLAAALGAQLTLRTI